MPVLVLRPERAARRTVEGLAALGLEAIVSPVLAIETLDTPIPPGPYDAVLATSANGLRKLNGRPEIRELSRAPLMAVGDRTAEAGREAGFANVEVADGDGRSLAAAVVARFGTPGRFLHAAGADRAFDLQAALRPHGHKVEVVDLYRAAPASTLTPEAEEALRRGAVIAVLHHSRRIAETFLSLSGDAGLAEAVRTAPHAALALRVAEPLLAAGCADVAVAERPDEPALFDALARLIGTRSQSGGERSK
ncbi:uroporphyrinogen-III synthase [Methylopila musalis]|uniref:Uroporphyrinogen-III synthase n=1 Tax=Methylopila musalis TaxID=1134781 RepID=A0ABW3ZD62_9HYPH